MTTFICHIIDIMYFECTVLNDNIEILYLHNIEVLCAVRYSWYLSREVEKPMILYTDISVGHVRKDVAW